MAKYRQKAVARANGVLPSRHDEERERRAHIAVYVHENDAQVRVKIRGCGTGGHQASIRFDDGSQRFAEAVAFEWDGDEHEFPLPYVPTAFIAVVDGSDEIRTEEK